mmetsp:Transcript_33255/g.72668  ORF Transcript_33255/g.72668 Transcript_33255/m.72668 type:complete len:229 (+) Transcript_33255:163-849(+)
MRRSRRLWLGRGGRWDARLRRWRAWLLGWCRSCVWLCGGWVGLRRWRHLLGGTALGLVGPLSPLPPLRFTLGHFHGHKVFQIHFVGSPATLAMLPDHLACCVHLEPEAVGDTHLGQIVVVEPCAFRGTLPGVRHPSRGSLRGVRHPQILHGGIHHVGHHPSGHALRRTALGILSPPPFVPQERLKLDGPCAQHGRAELANSNFGCFDGVEAHVAMAFQIAAAILRHCC